MARSKTEVRRVRIFLNGKEIEDNFRSIAAAERKATNDLKGLTKGTAKYKAKLAELQKIQKRQAEYTKDLRATKQAMLGMRGPLTALKGMILSTFAPLALLGFLKGLLNIQQALERSRKKIHEFTGATGDELDGLTAKVQATADTFGQEFDQVIKSANTLSKRLGISMPEALDVINEGFISGANAAGDMLDIVQEYSGFAKEAGINARAFLKIADTAVENGVFSDKGVDMVKEAVLSLREMTPTAQKALKGIGLSGDEMQKQLRAGNMTLFEAMQKVSAQLAKFPDESAEVGAILADVFKGAGEDAGVDFVKALKDVNAEMGNLIDKGNERHRLQQLSLEANEKMSLLMNKLFGEGDGLFTMLAAKSKIFLVDGIYKIIAGTVDVINYFIDLYNQSRLFRQVIHGMGATIESTFGFFKAQLLSAWELVKGLGGAAKSLFNLDFEGAGAAMNKSGEAIAQKWSEWGAKSAKAYKEGFNQAKEGKQVEHVSFDLSAPVLSDVAPAQAARPVAPEAAKDEAKEKKRQQELEKQKEFLRSLELMGMDANARELAELEDKYAEMRRLGEQYGADLTAIETLYGNEKAALQKEHALAALEAQKKQAAAALEEERKKVAARLQMQQDLSNGLLNMMYLTGQGEVAMADFMRTKTLIQIGMDTAAAISSLVKNSEGNPANSVTFGGAGIAQFVQGFARITGNMAMASQILKSQGSPSMPSIPGYAKGGLTPDQTTLATVGEKGIEYVVPNHVVTSPAGSELTGMLEELRIGSGNQGQASIVETLNRVVTEMTHLRMLTQQWTSRPFKASVNQDMLEEQEEDRKFIEAKGGISASTYFDS